MLLRRFYVQENAKGNGYTLLTIFRTSIDD